MFSLFLHVYVNFFLNVISPDEDTDEEEVEVKRKPTNNES